MSMSLSSMLGIVITILLILIIILFVNLIESLKKLNKVILKRLDDSQLKKYKKSSKIINLNNNLILYSCLLNGMMFDRIFLYNDNFILFFIIISNFMLFLTAFLKIKNLKNTYEKNPEIKYYRNKAMFIQSILAIVNIIFVDVVYFIFWSIN